MQPGMPNRAFAASLARAISSAHTTYWCLMDSARWCPLAPKLSLMSEKAAKSVPHRPFSASTVWYLAFSQAAKPSSVAVVFGRPFRP